MQTASQDVDYAKIINRETIRLKMSLDAAKKLQKTSAKEILVFLHFPPVWNGFVCREIVDTLHEYGIKSCYFGHIHGAYYQPRTQTYEGIEMVLCAADALSFAPMPIYSEDF